MYLLSWVARPASWVQTCTWPGWQSTTASSNRGTGPANPPPTSCRVLPLLLLFVSQPLTRVVPCTADQTQRAVSTLRLANRMVNSALAQRATEQNRDYVRQALAFQPVEVGRVNWVLGSTGQGVPQLACQRSTLSSLRRRSQADIMPLVTLVPASTGQGLRSLQAVSATANKQSHGSRAGTMACRRNCLVSPPPPPPCGLTLQ
jgi:hypothetical protein